MSKGKLALYWAASCGGCEIAVLELREKILKVAEAFDIVFWPVAVDFKYKDVEAMADKEIDLCLFNGGIRTSENEHIAKLMRKKSKVLVSFGACATWGGIPGLANGFKRETILERAYFETPSTDNPQKTLPQTSYKVPEGDLTLPSFYDRVMPLKSVVEVDYFIPGCPPIADRIWDVILVLLSGNLPPKGATVGTLPKTCCDECLKTKEEKKVKKFVRPWEIIPDPKKCLLEQGIVCMGPATQAGCGAQCTSANMPCRGCYGPAEGVEDMGLKMLGALGAIVDSTDPDEIKKVVSEIEDPMGTLYRFTLADSLLRRART
jgi:F420-non-reducing hydrogenase small subunit